MGTYPTTPSYVLKTNELLQDVLNANKEKLIGQTVLKKFGTDLPFLPKILSIAKALPLQIHPDIELSKRLHEKDPNKFGDTNHKPEIAIALSKFEAFCGFKPNGVIQNLLELPTLQNFLPNDANKPIDDETLREICKSLLVADEETVATTMEELQKVPNSELGDQSYILELLPRLIDQYGKTDNGSLVALICMNYLTFEPGQAIWIPADGIHAYLQGDIVECMARSDNVLNTGFCPRGDRDSADLFTQALTFKQHDAQTPLLPRVDSEFSTSGKTAAFKPPISEFQMLVTEMSSGEKEEIKPIGGPSIMFVTHGKGTMTADGQTCDINEGHIYFVGCDVTVKIEASDELAIYRAYAE
jgi:mannose-6-phosphate isomerase